MSQLNGFYVSKKYLELLAVRSVKLLLRVLLITNFFQLSFAEDLKAILYSKENQIHTEQLNKLLAHPLVKTSKPLFTENEKLIFKDQKLSRFVNSFLIEFSNFENLNKFAIVINSNKYFKLSYGISPQSTSENIEDPFYNEQWHLNNKGVAQKIDIDPMYSFLVPGLDPKISKEDLNIPPLLLAPLRRAKVAILDTGIDPTHPDLMDNIYKKPSECRALAKFNECLDTSDNVDCPEIDIPECKNGTAPLSFCREKQKEACSQKVRNHCEKKWFDLNNPEVDQDKNGYPMDCYGWSIVGHLNNAGIIGKPDFDDVKGHGTHVAGIIGAKSNNGIGVKSCSDSIDIIPVQVLSEAPLEPVKPLSYGLTPVEKEAPTKRPLRVLGDMVARGLLYAIHSGADVVNFSLGWPEERDSDFLREIVAEAQSRGMIIVAAAGNDSTQALLRPCSYPGVICVAAHGPDGSITHFSNYGMGVDIAAPGLNILSTWPVNKRPIRFGNTYGYEYLNGTSQASPQVSCVIGDMISRGIPKNEIYPRLILGAREHKENLPLIMGNLNPVNDSSTEELLQTKIKKWTLSGNIDESNSLTQIPVPLILPYKKELGTIFWERTKSNLIVPFELKNFWSPTSDQVDVSGKIVSGWDGIPLPKLIKIEQTETNLKLWNGINSQNNIRSFNAIISLSHLSPLEISRIPSEMALDITIKIKKSIHRNFQIGFQLIVPVSKENPGHEMSSLPIVGLPRSRYKIVPISHYYDDQVDQIEYVVMDLNKDIWKFSLLKPEGEPTDKYVNSQTIDVKPPLVESTLLDDTTRIDLNFDGISEYVITLTDKRSFKDSSKPSPVEILFFNNQFKLTNKISYSSELAQFPDNPTTQIQWMKLGEVKVPSWLGFGKDPHKKWTLEEAWENPDLIEDPQIRFYYLDQNGNLEVVEGKEDYMIIELLSPNNDSIKKGMLSVLMAKSKGPKSKPSYLLDFALATISDGKIVNFEKVDFFKETGSYFNLLDTRTDSAYSTDIGNSLYSGTFWFGSDIPKQTRLAFFNQLSNEFYDFNLLPIRKHVDAALWARYAYWGRFRKGAFVLTNSEIQYHDLESNKVVSTSLRRYTFYKDYLTSNGNFPTLIGDKKSNQSYLPALFTTEGSLFNRGIRFLIPAYDDNNQLKDLYSPAYLRLETQKGCAPIDTPTWMGEKGYSILDFNCGDRFIRVPLNI